MDRLTGLTWDHPRGYVVLDALGTTAWDRQSLEGFESHPLDELAGRYDLLVIDHPGLGAAVRTGSLQPLDTLFDRAELDRWRVGTIGQSFDSYALDDRQWALPIDAAAQVSVSAPRLDERPVTWAEACDTARRTRTVLCLGGPHAFLMFAAICLAFGATFTDRDAGRQALEIMASLLGNSDREFAQCNPIAVLDAMASGDGPAYCPLVYGYLTYQRAGALRFFDAPRGSAGIGSVLGGTGVAITRSCTDLATARTELRRLLSPEVQVDRYAELGGQSAARAAWDGEPFYRDTRATVETAWVRPRFPGYVPFQADASHILRDGLLAGTAPDRLLDRLDARYAAAHEGIPR